MSILKQIIDNKLREVETRKALYPIALLEKSIYYETPVVSMTSYLRRPDKVGIIAEIKRRSPGNGRLNPHINVENLSIGYMQAGASALSVLSDKEFFGGSSEDVKLARKFNYCPILRKDFIVDEYQVFETKSIGADCILLIASCLDPATCQQLAKISRDIGLEVLLEVHSEEELATHLNDQVNIVGINNRNLKTLKIELETSERLAEKIPAGFARISESGIDNPQDVVRLSAQGYDGFLIGTRFMKHANPDEACAEFIRSIKALRHEN